MEQTRKIIAVHQMENGILRKLPRDEWPASIDAEGYMSVSIGEPAAARNKSGVARLHRQ